ncbi:MAG: thermonuclease family protein, partial [Desulfuromonadales bacterium]|nr:thermonuclease family protein [Desulfuromonadales bacterium]
MKVFLLGIAVVLLLLQPALLWAAEGQVLKVVDGDRFRVERVGSKGPETLELHLRCSDAPVLSSLFGQESKQYLESLLRESDSVNFKIQAYCGSELCVEVFAYTPPPIDSAITYINTRMIAAGMARNDSCRGQFQEAEDQAKAAKKGIWSTTEKIVFAESELMAKSAGAQMPTAAPAVTVQAVQKSPALIEVDRVERTVTLKSRSISLSRAINAIDMVSTQPVSLYLIEEQYLPLALDKVPWYAALQKIVQTANLKQVNMNGKIDLYDQSFYYKHIAPYLKLSDNDGVYINVRNSANDAPVVDDGVTRYVFVNDFENSAAPPEAKDEGAYGYVQVH